MEPEITPTVFGERRFSPVDQPMDSFPAAVEARAIVEGQFMAKRCHAHSLGYEITPDSRVLATGGAAVNPAIRQVGAPPCCSCYVVLCCAVVIFVVSLFC